MKLDIGSIAATECNDSFGLHKYELLKGVIMAKPVVTLVIEGTYPWYRGGVSEWISRYIQAFPDYHFNIIQIATDPYLQMDLNRALYSVPGNVKEFKRIQPIQPPAYRSNGEKEASAWLCSCCETVRSAFDATDIIHIANTGFAGWLGMKVARENGKPLILTEHALYWKEVELGATALECGYKVPAAGEGKNQMAILFKQIAIQVYREADEVISVSKCNIPEQQALGAGKVRYIPNGVDKNWLQLYKKRNEDPVIGWVGRCAEMKNPLRFFDVIDAFRRKEVKARYMMLICDANEDRLQRKVKQKAKKYPELKLVYNQPAEQYLDEMDMLCITSCNESQPLVLFEALAKKVLPIGWEVGDVSGEYGIVIPSFQTADDLVDKVLAIWLEPALWKRQVEERFKMITSRHTWPTIFQEYRELFKRYLKTSIKI